MSKKQTWLLFMYIFVFLTLIAIAIFLQSELFLYAASAMPILIVTALPDIRRYQYIRGKKAAEAVQIYKQSGEEDQLLTITFQPGYIRWNSKKLFFQLSDIKPAPDSPDRIKEKHASLSVLGFDLSAHPGKKGWIGIDLEQLALRTANLSYTTDEITRLVLSMRDVEETARHMKPSAAAVSPTNNKSISA